MRVVVLALAVGASSEALAQDGSVETYPRALAARPLLLPMGGIEGTGTFDFSRTEQGPDNDALLRGELELYGRYGLGQVELEAGAALNLFYDADNDFGEVDIDTVQSLFARAKILVAPELALVPSLAVGQPFSDLVTSLVPGVSLLHKAHFSPVAALEVSGGVFYSRSFDRTDTGADFGDSLFGQVHLGFQLQVHPLLAVLARADYGYIAPRNQAESVETPNYLAQNYGVGASLSVTPDVDVTLATQILETDNGSKVFTLAVTARRIP